MKEVTDPEILAQLDSGSREVTDPEVLEQLENQESDVVRTVKNIPRSAGNFVSSIASAVMSPIDTAKGIRSAYRGAINNALPSGWVTPYQGQEQDIAVADAVGGFYKGRYGSLRQTKETLIEDPVGFLSDASLVLGGASSALKTAGLAKAAKATAAVSKYSDPLYLAGKAIQKTGAPIYKAVVGQTTGAGARVVDEALKGSPEFVDAMRGNTSEAQIVEKAKGALDDIRQQRGDAYRAKLESLKGKTNQIDIQDIKALADDQIKRYNVTQKNGKLDFSRSSASGSSAKEIEEVYKMVQDWGSKPGDLTPAMLDILKRRLDDFYAEGRTSRAMVTSLKKAVQEKLVKAVPEYADMTQDYAKASEVIGELERAVGLGSKTAADTAIRKLTMALREDKKFRADLLKTLEKNGDNITGAVSGAVMNPVATRGLGSMVAGGAGVIGLLTMSPSLASLIPLASPRVVGELSVVLGKLGRNAGKVSGPAKAAYQAGRLPLEEQE